MSHFWLEKELGKNYSFIIINKYCQNIFPSPVIYLQQHKHAYHKHVTNLVSEVGSQQHFPWDLVIRAGVAAEKMTDQPSTDDKHDRCTAELEDAEKYYQ